MSEDGGKPETTLDPVRDGDPEASRELRKPRRKALIAVAIGVGVLLLVVAGAVTVSILNQSRTPQATAEEYFAALEAGDATTANALTSAGNAEDQDTSLLTDEILQGATEHISDVSVTPAEDPLDVLEQKLEVSYTLAGEHITHSLFLERGEPEWGFLNTWRLRFSSVPRVSISAEGPGSFTIAGAPIEADASAVRLFPAVYPVAATDSTYFDLADDELVINGVDTTSAVEFVPTAALEAEAQEQVDQMVDACAESTVTSAQSDGCSLFVVLAQSGHVPGAWEIIEYPTVELSLGGRVYATTGGRAQFTPDGGGEPVEMIREIELSGTVEVSDHGARLIPWGTE